MRNVLQASNIFILLFLHNFVYILFKFNNGIITKSVNMPLIQLNFHVSSNKIILQREREVEFFIDFKEASF